MKPVKFIAACASLVASFGIAQAQFGSSDQFETTSLGQDTFAIGTLTSASGAMSPDLWRGANAEDISTLLELMPTRFADATSADVLRRALLSPGAGPAGADKALTGRKLMALARAGFYQEAASIADLSGGLSNEPELSQAIAYAAMMDGNMTEACRRGANLQTGKQMPFWLKLRLICYSISDEPAAADLTLGLLRDLDLFTGDEEAIFTAVATGTKPRGKISPQTGFHYVAVRQLQADLDFSNLMQVDGAVLRALATEETAPQLARVQAAQRAVYLGLMSGEEVAEVYSSLAFQPEQIAGADAVLRQAPQNILVDPLVYQRVSQMTALEDTLDRAALVGKALQSAGSLERFMTLAHLYAPVARNFEVIVNYAPYAREFVLAGIVAGDQAMTEQWLRAMAADQTNPAGREQAQELLALLAYVDEQQARNLAAFNGLELDLPQPSYASLNSPSWAVTADEAALPELVKISLRTFQSGSTGQHALVALAAANMQSSGVADDIRQIVLSENQIASNLDTVSRRAAFYEEAASMIAALSADASSGSVPSVQGQNDTAATGPAARIKPRVKPEPNG